MNAVEQYVKICAHANHAPCEDLTEALKRKERTVTAKEDSVSSLLSLLISGCAPFIQRVHLPTVLPEHREQLANFVLKNTHVQELDVTDAAIGNAGVLAILAALRNSTGTSISVLDAANVGLTKKGALDAATILSSTKFSSLRSLNLGRNCIENVGVVAIEKAAQVAGISVFLEGNLCTVECLNALTHGLGATGAVCAGVCMARRAIMVGAGPGVFAAVIIFAVSLFTMLTCSCLYHASHRQFELNKTLRKADHCGVFLLIAGTYTPFVVMYALDTITGPFVLLLIWGCAFIGVLASTGFLKASSTGRVMFALGMGWIAVFPAKLIFERMQRGAIALVFSGGISYSVGTIFYFLGRKRIPIMHVVWHIAVMIGGALHYIALWRYVLSAA